MDLEDRYYHNTWKALGVGTDQASTTGPPKPIEARDLAHPTTSTSQGKLYMWLEILPAGEARMRPPVNFERPPEMKIEVRVIVWAMTGYSTSERSVDYFVKTYLKGDARRKRETDTHWRSKSGSAQWNWRHKHVVEVRWGALDVVSPYMFGITYALYLLLVLLERCHLTCRIRVI